ncbi:alkaline phosphatase family protein [Aggregicoccus sp. 17bor-14]|uniref:alkaline phosphatase family protein n=1 Tax=Myxococcaceae TaxID=31 RepID=UPI00129C2491|nr:MULTISPECIES: alkaline phosphatase family protein [Myxococcaceae]MBF5044237.1 alkaline phosphatase family protein [Simulacricoccus sp. 17bor-14]MRI89987.1 alkaline phosphatase family protein [Aggregicoccus sp. 17bor-14]
MRRSLLLASLLLALPASAKPPRLTLFVSVDALGTDVLLRNRPKLTGALAQLLDAGAVFPDTRYLTAEARTAPGHSTLATGAHPWRHGIVDNEVGDRATGKALAVFADGRHPILEVPLDPTEDSCPEALQAETLADRLRTATQERGKAVALSYKARAALPLAGRLGQAYWFSDVAGKFVTSTWYTKAVPEWLSAFNARKLPDAAFGKTWELALPPIAYVGEDDRPFEGTPVGMGRTFPHALTGGLSAPGKDYYEAFRTSGFSHDLLVQAAKAAIAGEKLGQDEVPDLLSVSFSGTDYVFHAYGPYSWEMQDSLVRLDRALTELIAAAERAAGGRQNLLVVLSADHGGAAAPEEWAAAGLPAKRLDPHVIEGELRKELQTRFGAGEYVVRIEQADVYLGGKALSGRTDGIAVRRAVAAWLARQPYAITAVARDDLFNIPDVGGYVMPMRRGYYPDRSGDVIWVPRPFIVVDEETFGANHGTPHGYDTQVPFLLMGRGVKPGYYPQQIAAVDIAPTVAALMELGAPASAEGRAREEAFALPRPR